jgi:opacity protein-like surface antigen
VAPHVMVFGDLGWFRNLQSDLTPTLNTAVASIQNTQGLNVAGGGTLPALYSIGGVRLEIPVSHMFVPYVLGGAGAARLNPTQVFTFVSGTLPDGTSPAIGADVTSTLATSGSVQSPGPSTAFMYTLGGGVQMPIASRWIIDAAYRYSHIAADTTLSAAPLNTNGMTFGLGYRF